MMRTWREFTSAMAPRSCRVVSARLTVSTAIAR